MSLCDKVVMIWDLDQPIICPGEIITSITLNMYNLLSVFANRCFDFHRRDNHSELSSAQYKYRELFDCIFAVKRPGNVSYVWRDRTHGLFSKVHKYRRCIDNSWRLFQNTLNHQEQYFYEVKWYLHRQLELVRF